MITTSDCPYERPRTRVFEWHAPIDLAARPKLIVRGAGGDVGGSVSGDVGGDVRGGAGGLRRG